MKVILLHLCDETRSRLSSQLQHAGLDVLPLAFPEDLLALASPSLAAVLVVDLQLPGVHEGMELLSQCRTIDPNLPVIALGEQNDVASAVEAVQKGARDVLTETRIARLADVCRQEFGVPVRIANVESQARA